MTASPTKSLPGHAEKDILFSVIIPAYNVGTYIEETLKSVLNQTLQSFEIIVIDDGSSDDTAERILRMEDTRIHLIRKKNQGVSVARNLGIQQSSGIWIAFLDGDDVWMPRHLELCKKCFDRYPEAAWVASSYIKVQHIESNPSISMPESQKDCFKLFRFFSYFKYDPNFVWTSATAIRKTALCGAALFPEGISHGEDTLAWLLLASHCPEIGIITIPTVYYRQREGSAVTAIVGNELRLMELTAGMMDYLASAPGREKDSDEAREFYRLYIINEWSLMLRLFSFRRHVPLLKKSRDFLGTTSYMVLCSFFFTQEIVRRFFYILLRLAARMKI